MDIVHGTAIGRPGRRPKGSAPLGHGTRQRYSTGCRCDECKGAQSAYRLELKRLAGPRKGQRHCSDCGAPISKSRHVLCPDCRPKPTPVQPAPRVSCNGGCGKQLLITSLNPMCQVCRSARRAATPKPLPKITTHCVNGHERTSENTRFTKSGARRCKVCESEYERQYRADGRRPKIRGHRTWRRLRDEYRAECSAAKLQCWICAEPIDYSLVCPDRWAFEADHVLSVMSHPDRALDVSNLAPSHAKCNRSRGATYTEAHAVAKQRSVFLSRELELAKLEIAELRQLTSEPMQLRLIG